LIASFESELDFSSLYNIFEDVINLPEIEKIKEILIKSKAEAVLMSGSGPSVFGIFNDECEAQNAKEKLVNAGFEAYCATSASGGETL
jgi:4-diphosphocytidyl-2-C-methyl-D-erythritol kinase